MKVCRQHIQRFPAGLILRLFDQQGRIGQGEASPLAGYSPDTLEASHAELSRIDWKVLPDAQQALPVAVDGVAALLSRLQLSSPAATFAVETALLDLLGQQLGRSLPSLLAPDAAAIFPVPLSALLPREADAVQAAEEAYRRGVATVKLKVGNDHQAELITLRRLRRAFGDRLGIRLDANQRLAPAVAPRLLRDFADFSPEFIEEPVAPEGLLALGPSPIPLALDEALQRLELLTDLERWISGWGIRALVLKPMALGGNLACLALARRARPLGLKIVVTHLMDGPVGLSAAAALALALGAAAPCGLDTHSGLARWPATRLPYHGPGQLVDAGAPGLGVSPLE